MVNIFFDVGVDLKEILFLYEFMFNCVFMVEFYLSFVKGFILFFIFNWIEYLDFFIFCGGLNLVIGGFWFIDVVYYYFVIVVFFFVVGY